MSLIDFIQTISELGRVSVPEPEEISYEAFREVDEALKQLEAIDRCNAPSGVPGLVIPWARWAALAMYRGCQLLVYRELGSEALAELMPPLPPEPRSVAAHYSADLMLRYLPDLYRISHAASSDDPLNDYLLGWGLIFPLSSTGCGDTIVTAAATSKKSGPGGEPVGSMRDYEEGLDRVLNDLCLRRIYVDRILARGDAWRLEDTDTRRYVEVALGMHADLAPKAVALKLEAYKKNTETSKLVKPNGTE